MLEQSFRAIDEQVRGMVELDDKTEQVITLSVAALGGALATGAFMAGRVDGWGFALLGGFAVAVAANIGAVLFFVRAYGALDRSIDLETGPRPDWLSAKAQDASWTELDHVASVLASNAKYYEQNAATMGWVTAERRRGVRWLIGAVLAYAAIGFLFLLGWTMGGAG